MTDKKTPLSDLRDRIDEIDVELQSLLDERMRVAQQVAKEKASSGRTNFYRPEREAEILRKVIGRNEGPLSNEAIVAIYREIISATLSVETPLTIAFLGPEGTYTHSAANKHFGQSITVLPIATIADVFHYVEKGQAHYGVVPIENSTEGVVTHTLDRFLDSPLKICGEIQLRIRHQLMSLSKSLDEIDTIYAHSQSLAQCREWLTKNIPNVKTIAMSSNAEAAQASKSLATSAAIASQAAATLYDLPILCEDIEDDPGNTTRFLAIGKIDTEPSGDDKTSLLISSPNKSGALHRLLTPLAKHGVSMTRVESRPSRKALWDYVFFIDIEGHISDKKVARVFAELEQEAAFVKLLGSYPRAIL